MCGGGGNFQLRRNNKRLWEKEWKKRKKRNSDLMGLMPKITVFKKNFATKKNCKNSQM